jgi:hypothetical protein
MYTCLAETNDHFLVVVPNDNMSQSLRAVKRFRLRELAHLRT